MFLNAGEKHFDQNRIALNHSEGRLTYSDLFRIVTIPINDLPSVEFVGGERSIAEYLRLFACLFLGKPYCPLNPKFGPERIFAIQELISSVESSELMADLAYIIFTSGTTGTPKGVPITKKQLTNRASTFLQILRPCADDRIMQLADFSFDLSIIEMVVAWSSGASLYSIPADKILLAARYAKEYEITIWFSVPSVISMSHKLGLLKPGSLPKIKAAFFGGEALTFEAARIFQLAAPNAKIFNFYGPTEATISVAHFEIPPDMLHTDFDSRGLPSVIPIGLPHSDVKMQIINPQTMLATDGIGELCVSTEQLTSGYIGAPELNTSQFFEQDGGRWYRTGDLASWDERYGYLYLGRIDRQIKFKGYRIELQDIESALRAASKSDLVCAVPHPVLEDGTIEGLVGVVGRSSSCNENTDQILGSLTSILPSYMVPAKVLMIDEMPLSINGKVDFKAVQNWVNEQLT